MVLLEADRVQHRTEFIVGHFVGDELEKVAVTRERDSDTDAVLDDSDFARVTIYNDARRRDGAQIEPPGNGLMSAPGRSMWLPGRPDPPPCSCLMIGSQGAGIPLEGHKRAACDRIGQRGRRVSRDLGAGRLTDPS